MDACVFMRRVKYASVAIIGAMIAGTTYFSHSAVAEEASGQPEVMQEITIVAPYLVHKQVVGRSTIGAPIEVLSISRRVSYADLDLTKASDAATLKKRISDTAKDACEYLFSTDHGTTLPPVTSSRACAKTATAEAMMLANDVIAASNG